jgi:predicted nuclease of predicted toxin-antitoxin system
MRFLLDNNAPAALLDVLRNRRHEAEFSREQLGEEAPDTAVLDLAIQQQAVILTWDRRDFVRLYRKHRFALLSFKCRALESGSRLDVALPYIEFAHARAAPPEHRLHIAIGHDRVTIYE